MKVTRYKMQGYYMVYDPVTASVESRACAIEVERPWSEENEALAQQEALGGEYTVDGEAPELTQEQRITELEEALALLLSGVTE